MKALPIAILSLILSTFSCDDHVIPDGNLLLKTLPSSTLIQPRFLKFRLIIKVKSLYQNTELFTQPTSGVPAITTWTQPLMIPKSYLTLRSCWESTSLIIQRILSTKTFFYYRAYAILDDGSVIYGNRISFTI